MHISEDEYCDYVESELEQEYGQENVERHYTFRSGREADFLVFDDQHKRMEAWEVENDSTALINGLGQALFYQQAAMAETFDTSCIAVLCYPEDHIDEDEKEIFRRTGVQLRPIKGPQ